MSYNNSNIVKDVFALKSIKAAKVSEISEATASSPIDPKDRVNFHIGNPVQNDELALKFLKLVLGLASNSEIKKYNKEKILSFVGAEQEDSEYIEWLFNTIKKCAPYMPRGGYGKTAPNELINYFYSWLSHHPTDPLIYDLGQKSGKRECTIASGGLDETFRVLIAALDKYSECDKIYILSFAYRIPEYIIDDTKLLQTELPHDESMIVTNLENHFDDSGGKATYLIINESLKEETRRALRLIALDKPLFFIETNNSSNDTSLAREAGISENVLRIISPKVFDDRLRNSSITFLAGPAKYINIFETVHFQLKGTPSAAEVELIQFLIRNNFKHLDELPNISETESFIYEDKSKYEFQEIRARANTVADSLQEIAKKHGNKLSDLSIKVAQNLIDSNKQLIGENENFQINSPLEVIKKLFSRFGDESFIQFTQQDFLTVFAQTHQMYNADNLMMVSGSSRTALGVLGFHCGLSDVVCGDLSWTYEHCFPRVTAIPLTDEFELDIEAILNAVKQKSLISPGKIAVALNNPHNATGKLFAENSIKRLITELIRNNIYIIDDLAYQNVAPIKEVIFCKTIKQISLDLINEGKISSIDLSKVITVHSLSKTDCYAGARLSVIEINDKQLKDRFNSINKRIKPNVTAAMLSYLFYRNNSSLKNDYWLTRNSIMYNKMNAINNAFNELPKNRNLFDIEIKAPQGSMYPQMVINKLPGGLSLDWLASNLATQGIGLIPLSTFARTSKGYALGRKAFRLTLGGSDTPESILVKTRRVLIDLNRIIADQNSKYNRIFPTAIKNSFVDESKLKKTHDFWFTIERYIIESSSSLLNKNVNESLKNENLNELRKEFYDKYLPSRLSELKQNFIDQISIINQHLTKIKGIGFHTISERLSHEFYKDDLEQRKIRFRNRSYDRTVHPTQVYSLEIEKQINLISEEFILDTEVGNNLISNLTNSLVKEYIGSTVAIDSVGEAEELKLDLRSLFYTETYHELNSKEKLDTFLSFWGDWDGSSRPSGQGHRLVAAALVENVTQLSKILLLLARNDASIKLNDKIFEEIKNLKTVNESFWNLLNDITTLTNQLEKRYRSVLPYSITSSGARKLGMKLGLATDPLTKLWQHNDRLEQKMNALRSKRRDQLEYYFQLNKKLRKTLHENIPAIIKNLNNDELLYRVITYKDILKRFALTPRIHQKLITAKDQFSINTTVYNLTEINELAGKYGNPGMVLGLQVSMSTTPEALKNLERKLYAEKERVLLAEPNSELPDVWCIPLFEDVATVNEIESYLDKIWEFAIQSSGVDETPEIRFTKIMCEIFIAGSDLSQQIGQTASWFEYNNAKHMTINWLAKKGLTNKVRLKLGSGEPMQRQGGYYSYVSGKPAFIKSENVSELLKKHLKESTVTSTEFATTPLHGVMARADLQTFQSNLSEKIRNLPLKERSEFLFHVQQAQKNHRDEIQVASEPFVNTRLNFDAKGKQELRRITIGNLDQAYETFVRLTEKNFKNILYGTDTDVVGIHLISYFVSRTTPTLRDRPTVRPSSNLGSDQGQKILERIASTIPLSKHGSLLRAIGHNRAQSMILGVNQLTTGLFRSFKEFVQLEFESGPGTNLLTDRILPILPVYEILHTLRIYTDTELKYVNNLAGAFPPGLVSLSLLREDIKAITEFVPALQKELLRRHGLNVSEFFVNDKFITQLLPSIRPDLAAILQPDIFNCDSQEILSKVGFQVSKQWDIEFENIVKTPELVKDTRDKIWSLLQEPVSEQVKSFTELAIALNTLSKGFGDNDFSLSSKKLQNTRFETNLTDLLKGKVDDSMRQFLSAAVQYLTRLPDEVVEVPIDIVRALKEVERILRIEEQALNKKDQQKLNFYILQIARLVGENG